MTSATPGASRILGSLRSVDGAGIVRIEARYDVGVDEVWSAITDPARLAAWHAEVEGDLAPGGEFRIYVASDDWEGVGRVVACEPPRHFVVTTRESDESWQKGQGAPPFEDTLEVTLTAEEEGTVLVAEVRGIPLEPLPFYGAGWQLHAESLAAYLAGTEPGDVEARVGELVPAYQALAADLGSG